LNSQSEKRKQDLLADIVLEEQRGRELSKTVKELLPEPKKTATGKPSRARKVLSLFLHSSRYGLHLFTVKSLLSLLLFPNNDLLC
jgi:hypothetical protein